MSNIKPTEAQICKLFIRNVKQLQAYKQFPFEFTILHVPNESYTTKGYRSNLYHMGLLPGAPDYLILYTGGRVAAIEFKRDKSSPLSISQKEFRSRCGVLDIPYLLTYDIEEAIEFIKKL